MSSSTEERASPLRSYDGRIAYRVPKDVEAAAAADAAREWTTVSRGGQAGIDRPSAPAWAAGRGRVRRSAMAERWSGEVDVVARTARSLSQYAASMATGSKARPRRI